MANKIHPRIAALFDTLPAEGTDFPTATRQAWLTLASALFEQIYREPEPTESIAATRGSEAP